MSIRSLLKKIVPDSLIRYRRERCRQQSLRRQQVMNSKFMDRLIQSAWVSQAGQDLWVYGNVFNEKRHGYFVDLGAHDGCYLSNTLLLEKRYEWQGLLIEANPQTFQHLQENRASTCVRACVSSKSETVRFLGNSVLGGIIATDCDNKMDADSTVFEMQTMPFESVLEEFRAPKVIDYLSVDIEGAEDRALLEFPFGRYTFLCCTIERPSSQLRNVLQRNHYRLVAEIPGLDSFYVHESFCEAYHKNTIEFYKKTAPQVCASRCDS